MTAIVFLACMIVCIVRNDNLIWVVGDAIGVAANLIPLVVVLRERHRRQEDDFRSRLSSMMKIQKVQVISFVIEAIVFTAILFSLPW